MNTFDTMGFEIKCINYEMSLNADSLNIQNPPPLNILSTQIYTRDITNLDETHIFVELRMKLISY